MKGGDSMISLSKLARSGALAVSTFALGTMPVFAEDVTTITINDTGYGITDLNLLISSGIKLAIILAAIITFAFLIWGGIEWITSGGDKAKYEAARNRITAALVGLAIVAAAWAIMVIVGKFLGINILNTGIVIPSARQ